MVSLLNTLANLAHDIIGRADKHITANANRNFDGDQTPAYINRIWEAEAAANALPASVNDEVRERLRALYEEAATLAGEDIPACIRIAEEMEDLIRRARHGEFDRV